MMTLRSHDFISLTIIISEYGPRVRFEMLEFDIFSLLTSSEAISNIICREGLKSDINIVRHEFSKIEKAANEIHFKITKKARNMCQCKNIVAGSALIIYLILTYLGP